MASYFPSSESERNASRILQDPLVAYSDAPVLPCNLMTYMNYSSSSGSNSNALASHTQQQHDSIGILSEASNANQSEKGILPGLGGPRIGDHDLNEWKNASDSMLLMTHVADAASVLQGPQNMQGQGLSLSLSTNVPSGFPMSSLQCHSPNTYRNGYFENLVGCQSKLLGHIEYVSPDCPRSSSDTVKADASPSGMPSSARAVPTSKYLKAAQQLLDEVVNVKKALKEKHSRNGMTKDFKEIDGGSKNGDAHRPGSGSSSNPQESNNNSPSQLSASEKQDLDNKMSKLLAMLDEVDKRYKQYYHQMQIVVSSFDVIAGSGAARPYTALALQTISRHFRCLRDAINDQVQETRKSLGEQDASGNSKGIGISRLRYVDQQIKQQRTLHQLGMMQQHAWRPQRGLPESSVTVLRAWLFEHFLHPYPKDADKIILARQTGLTRSQVSNWFINARVRLWKPMVEEMYKEETVDTEMDSSSHSNAGEKTTNSDIRASEDTGEDLMQSTISSTTDRHSRGQLFDSRSDHTADVEVEPTSSQSFQAASHAESESKYGLERSKGIQRPAMNNYNTSLDGTIVQSSEGSGRFMAAAAVAYQMSELERFENGSGVSLTLGLQHCDGSSVPMSIETPHGYMPMRGDGMYNETASSMVAQPSEFDYVDSGNRHHRLGSSHLLHDFVA